MSFQFAVKILSSTSSVPAVIACACYSFVVDRVKEKLDYLDYSYCLFNDVANVKTIMETFSELNYFEQKSNINKNK